MSKKQPIRTALTISALATGAAALVPPVAAAGVAGLNPLGKLNAIAGLAGLMLRLFRSPGQPRPVAGARKRPARIQQGCKKAVRSNQGGQTHG